MNGFLLMTFVSTLLGSSFDSRLSYCFREVIHADTIKYNSASFQGTVSVKGADGTFVPLPGVNVLLLGTTFMTLTSEQGKFLFSNIPPGSYKACMIKDGFEPYIAPILEFESGTKKGMKIALLKALEKRATVPPGIPKERTLEGSIIDHLNGRPIEGVGIELLGSGLSAVTDDSGHFLISPVPKGKFRMRASRSGYQTMISPLDFESSPYIKHYLVMYPGPVKTVQEGYTTLYDAPARTLEAIEPEYPEKALRDSLEGTVWLNVFVDEGGNPKKIEILRPSGNEFEAAAMTAIRKWKFKPAILLGKPVKAQLTVPVIFKLKPRK